VFIGHFAAGFAAKRAAPAVRLGTLFLAAEFLDLLWPWLLLSGLETAQIVPGITAASPLDFVWYPYSHSLIAAAGWSVALALGYWFARKSVRGSIVIGIVVLSHWLLDFTAHRPDLALAPGLEGRYGLDLWASLPATLTVELLLFAGGVAVYARSTVARDGIGKYGLWALVAFLLLCYLAALFGPPPPSITALAWGGHSVWLLVAWGYWVDRHRSATAK